MQFSSCQPWVLGAIVTYPPRLTCSGAGYVPGTRTRTRSVMSKVPQYKTTRLIQPPAQTVRRRALRREIFNYSTFTFRGNEITLKTLGLEVYLFSAGLNASYFHRIISCFSTGSTHTCSFSPDVERYWPIGADLTCLGMLITSVMLPIKPDLDWICLDSKLIPQPFSFMVQAPGHDTRKQGEPCRNHQNKGLKTEKRGKKTNRFKFQNKILNINTPKKDLTASTDIVINTANSYFSLLECF